MNQVTQNLNALHAKEFAIALDDFGVGYSSFSYMRKLPLDYVKLDGAYVQNLLKHPENQAFIESVVILCHAFNMQTIAEFVEDKATQDILLDLKVDYMQGYSIGKPQAELLSSDYIE